MPEPEFKAGQTVWFVLAGKVMPLKIEDVQYVYITEHYIFDDTNDLFATKEEAERFLKENFYQGE